MVEVPRPIEALSCRVCFSCSWPWCSPAWANPTLAAPLPDELPAALPAAPPVAPLPMGSAPQPQPEAAEPDLPGSDAASADGEATTKDGLKIGNGSLRLRQDDPGPTRESPLRDPRLNPYAPRQP